MISYQIEDFRQALPEMEKLFPVHWDEVAIDKDIVPLNMWYEQYNRMHAEDKLHIVTVRDGDKLIGYHWSIVTPHLHYHDCLTAYTDGYFLLPEYRKGRNGINLFKFAEETLQKKGVRKMYVGSKIKHDKSAIFEMLGWTLVEKYYCKYIG